MFLRLFYPLGIDSNLAINPIFLQRVNAQLPPAKVRGCELIRKNGDIVHFESRAVRSDPRER